MNIPVVGYVTLQTIVVFLLWGGFCVYGLLSGFKKSSLLLAASVLAIAVAVIPQVNSFLSDLLSVLFSKKASGVAYLLAFTGCFFLFRLIFYRLPQMAPAQGKAVDKLLGLVSGFIMGFVYNSMLLVFLFTVRVPVDGLYKSSELAAFIVKVWHKLGLLSIVYMSQYLNPANWF